MRHAAGHVVSSLGLAMLVAMAAWVGDGAAADRELWKDILRAQLEREKSCKLNYITNERWLEIGGRAVVMARAHCVDKRRFDVSWREARQDFEIQLCGPQSC